MTDSHRHHPADIVTHDHVCPACNHTVAVPFFQSRQPLATIAWPETAQEADDLAKHDLDFIRCVSCGHITNRGFRYDAVPYSRKPNLMFNRGTNWSKFIDEVSIRLIGHCPVHPTVIEVGYGDGSFLASMADKNPKGRYIGFDPNGFRFEHDRIEFRAALFDPGVDFADVKPDLIVTRHVLEHLTNPLAFLQKISFHAAVAHLEPRLYIEVPCVDTMVATGRTVDLYYEHNSQFTTVSFQRMLARARLDILELGHGYQGEVVWALAKFPANAETRGYLDEALHYNADARQAHLTITRQLDELWKSGRRVTVWGGTGKSAAFMNHYGLDRVRFPEVVDSDEAKVGIFVPGTGQVIQFRDILKDTPPDILIIPPQWRAIDILDEMRQEGIGHGQVLIEHALKLIDFHADPHPYRMAR